MTRFWYEVDNGGALYFDSKDKYDIDDPSQHGWIIEECAQDYWSNCDGWDSHWPLTFTLLQSEDGPVVSTFVVEMEAEPVFHACQPARTA